MKNVLALLALLTLAGCTQIRMSGASDCVLGAVNNASPEALLDCFDADRKPEKSQATSFISLVRERLTAPLSRPWLHGTWTVEERVASLGLINPKRSESVAVLVEDNANRKAELTLTFCNWFGSGVCEISVSLAQ